MIKKTKSGYIVTSEKGKKLGGPYRTKQAAQKNPKFTAPQIGVDAEDPTVPEHWRTVDSQGRTVGVSLGAQVGDLLATVKAQQAIEALQLEVAALKVRVSKLEGGRGQ